MTLRIGLKTVKKIETGLNNFNRIETIELGMRVYTRWPWAVNRKTSNSLISF